jgi:hypothetical protein
LIVPKGCRTVSRRWRIFSGLLVEPTLHRLENVFMLPSGIRRSLAVVQLCLMVQLWQALVQ